MSLYVHDLYKRKFYHVLRYQQINVAAILLAHTIYGEIILSSKRMENITCFVGQDRYNVEIKNLVSKVP